MAKLAHEHQESVARPLEQRILSCLAGGPQTRDHLLQGLHVHPSTLADGLTRLMRKQTVSKIGPKRGGQYQVVGK